MKSKKLLVSLLLATSLFGVAALSGCSASPSDSSGAETSTSNPSSTGQSETVTFPEKPITIIVPWSAGGRGDTFARTVAIYLEESLGESVVVQNIPGGAGIVGTYDVANAAPDGHTLGSFASTHLFSYYLKNPKFPLEQLRPVGGYAEIYQCIVVKSDKPWNDFNEFIDDAKDNPDKYMHGNTGVGTDDHIYAEALYSDYDASVAQMPYNGDTGLVQGILSNEVDIAMIAMPSIASYVESGELRILAISSQERLDTLPDAPTFVEQGVDFTETALTGLYAPADTPDDVIAILEEALDYARDAQGYQEQLANMHVSVNHLNSDAYQELIDSTLPKIENWIAMLEEDGVALG